jgi:hypothetical protein
MGTVRLVTIALILSLMVSAQGRCGENVEIGSSIALEGYLGRRSYLLLPDHRAWPDDALSKDAYWVLALDEPVLLDGNRFSSIRLSTTPAEDSRYRDMLGSYVRVTGSSVASKTTFDLTPVLLEVESIVPTDETPAVVPAELSLDVPGAVSQVVSWGHWARDGLEGHLRLIVVGGGFEHVSSRVMLQWVAQSKSRESFPFVKLQIPIHEINNVGVWVVRADSTDGNTVFLSGVNSYDFTSVGWDLTASGTVHAYRIRER